MTQNIKAHKMTILTIITFYENVHTGCLFLTGAPLKVSHYIVNPIKKVLSVRIYLPAGT